MLADSMVTKVKKMERKNMERLIGKYCKIVTKEPGEKRVSVVSGYVEDVDHHDGFILVDSAQGLGCLRINTIVAIKPGINRNEKKTIKDTHAEVGIGTLIVFIAMVLVAAIAASVIIQTAESLQQRAYAVGKQTIRDVSSGVRIIDVTGYTNANKTRIEYLAIAVTPRAGSLDIDLNKTLLYLELNNFTILSLNNQAKAGAVTQGGIFSTLNFSMLNATNYGIIAIHDADGSIFNTNGMSVADQAMLMVNLSAALPLTHGLQTGETFEFKIVPEIGVSDIFVVNAPNTFKYRVEEL